jgi:hypothetical protein
MRGGLIFRTGGKVSANRTAKVLNMADLAQMLGVHPRDIRRGIDQGSIVPASSAGRATFSQAYANELKRRMESEQSREREGGIVSRRRMLGLNDLARELGVNRVTIERAIRKRTIIPSFRTASGRVRFEQGYVEQLKRQVDEARSRGALYVLKAIAAPKQPPEPTRLSAKRWAQQIVWKRKHGMRRAKPGKP